MFTDTHAHNYTEEFDADSDEMMSRALQQGINRIFLPNIDSGSISRMMSLVKKYPENCFPMMGLHPCSVSEKFEDELKIAEDWLNKEKFYGIGETGIDLYWDKTFLEQQRESFRIQVNWAKERSLPVIIHARESLHEIFAILDRENDERLKGIFHCFSGTKQDAEKIISYGGFKLGIGGVITFKNGGIDKFLAEIPPGHIVLETDSPYLAPVPYRGKRNESSYIPVIAEKLALIYGLNIEQVARITTANAKEIFRI